MNPNAGLITALNKMREMSVQENSVYHQYVPIVTDTTSISDFGNAILNVPVVMNEFVSKLVNRIVYTSFTSRYFNNPLQILEGDRIPLGYAGEEVYVNPAKGRQYNVNDFAGLLQKYEADVKVQYTTVNMDLQYCVTVTRHKLKQAFVSWDELERFIGELSNSLYNGAYIDEFQFTKALVSGAYKSNQVQVRVVDAPDTEAKAKSFVTELRNIYLGMALPSTEYNAWIKVGGYGRPVKIWSEPSDIVLLVRNDILAYLDVNVLASAFNMDKTSLMGRILPVDNFDLYDDNDEKVFDGSKILGFIGDSSWFRIKRQDMYLDEFYNANNRTWQYYLNLTKMYNYSLFANGVVIATEEPEVDITSLNFSPSSVTVEVGESVTANVVTVPVNATQEISYEASGNITIEKIENKQIRITGTSEGSGTVTASVGNVSATLNVTVTGSTPVINSISFENPIESMEVGDSITASIITDPIDYSGEISFECENCSASSYDTINHTVNISATTEGTGSVRAYVSGTLAEDTMTFPISTPASVITFDDETVDDLTFTDASVTNSGGSSLFECTVTNTGADTVYINGVTVEIYDASDNLLISLDGYIGDHLDANATATITAGHYDSLTTASKVIYTVLYTATSISVDNSNVSVTVGNDETVNITILPVNWNGTMNVEATQTDTYFNYVTDDSDGTITITGVAEGTGSITLSADSQSTTINVTVTNL